VTVPNWVKKVNKHCGADLHPGEIVEGATFGQPAGTFGRTVAFGVGGIVGDVVAERVIEKRKERAGRSDEGGIALTFPRGRNVVLAVTPARLLVFGHSAMSGNPKELIAEYPLDRVHEVAVEKKKMHQSMVVRFVDYSAVELDVVKAAKPAGFVEAFDRVKGRV
jgi:hypothetical protein